MRSSLEHPALLFSGGKGLHHLSAGGGEGVAGADSVPGATRRHRPQRLRGARVPRQAGRRDAALTAAVRSDADTIEKVIEEVAATRLTERGATRGDDRFSEAAMEDRKREGYF